MLTFRENMELAWGKGTWTTLDWVWKTQQTQDYFIDIRTRLYLKTSERTKDDWVTALDCYDPFIDSWDYAIRKLLILMGYNHWNQYYFSNMPFEQLMGLVDRTLKMYAVELNKMNLEKDFEDGNS
jgi:hypothetical protein